MASFRKIAALSAIAGACMLAAMSTATAQTVEPIQAAAAPVITVDQAFKRCPKTADQYADAMKRLAGTLARARALADENPLLLPDADFYEAELAAAQKCAPSVATLQH
jgi:hypothetical protein